MAVGIDISPRYQSNFDWSKVDNSDDPNRGVRYCWVKVSDGANPYDYKGLTAGKHVSGAKSRGIPVGGYHYAQLQPSPEAQADVLVGEVRRWGALGVVPLLDLEAPFQPGVTARNFGIQFCRRVAAAGLRPAVYMSAAFARVLRPDQWDIPGLVIVIARYGAVPEAAGSAQYTGRYDVHQYSSSGIRGGVDVDLDDSRNNSLLIGGFTVSDSSNIQALYDNYVVAKPSKVPGSTKSFTAEEFGRFTNANTYDFAVNQFPVLQANVLALVQGFNALGAQLSQVFTTIDGKLDAIANAVGAGSAAATKVEALRLDLKELAASPPKTAAELLADGDEVTE